MKLYVLNGPNLNLLGVREPDIYGKQTYEDLVRRIETHARELGVGVECRQTNHEGVLVDWIHEAYEKKIDGIVINPAAYTHTSIAILDALKATGTPAIEVHISDVDAREPFRRMSYLRPACRMCIAGHGLDGYLEAMDLLVLPQIGERVCK